MRELDHLSAGQRAEAECSYFKQRVLPVAVQRGYLSDIHPLAAFVDIEGIRRAIDDLKSAFPDHFQHAFAAKANTMRSALSLIRVEGLDCEVASPGELEQALRVGFEPGSIVYDEPAKSIAVLRRAIGAGVGLNIDNFQEYEHVCALVTELNSESVIGFRINPQVGAGTIGAMSTATQTSKFGVALEDPGNRQKLIDLYASRPWLTSIHTHVGSQGCSLDLMQRGIGKVVALAIEINDTIGRAQIGIIDIGGGLPVNFSSETISPTFSEYAELLRRRIPDLFTGQFKVKTEFGRSIFAKNGFIGARIACTKNAGGRRIAIAHAGAQIAARTVFMPNLWALRVSVFDTKGQLKQGPKVVQDVGGPCCFAGDIIAHERDLPHIEAGDYVVLHDTGAYYFSNPFFYNSLPAPAVYGVSTGADQRLEVDVWRPEQSTDDVLAVIG